MSGIYPNEYGSGIGEGHIKAFMHSYKNWSWYIDLIINDIYINECIQKN